MMAEVPFLIQNSLTAIPARNEIKIITNIVIVLHKEE